MVGEFKDDCFQNHAHYIFITDAIHYQLYRSYDGAFGYNGLQETNGNVEYPLWVHETAKGRGEDVTRGKRKGIKYIIKVL